MNVLTCELQLHTETHCLACGSRLKSFIDPGSRGDEYLDCKCKESARIIAEFESIKSKLKKLCQHAELNRQLLETYSEIDHQTMQLDMIEDRLKFLEAQKFGLESLISLGVTTMD